MPTEHGGGEAQWTVGDRVLKESAVGDRNLGIPGNSWCQGHKAHEIACGTH